MSSVAPGAALRHPAEGVEQFRPRARHARADRADGAAGHLRRLGVGEPGHYLGAAMSLPRPGTWTLTVAVRLDEFTAATASTDLRVR